MSPTECASRYIVRTWSGIQIACLALLISAGAGTTTNEGCGGSYP